MLDPILTSILDSDLYKFTQGAAVAHTYPRAPVRYGFINRGKHQFPNGFADELRNQIEHMSTLRLRKDEQEFLTQKCGRFLDPVYIDMVLAGYQFDPREVTIDQEGGELSVQIEGNWARTIYWEVPLMATICELYYKLAPNPVITGTHILTDDEIKRQGFVRGMRLAERKAKLAEMGARRRHSLKTQRLTLEGLMAGMGPHLMGTSNVMLAHEYDLTPIGTQAHEWFMFHAAKYGYRSANNMSLGRWIDYYGGELGIALTDTFTTEDFFRTFDVLYARQFRGVRHDSGDAFEFMEKVIKHYESLSIDPKEKLIVFSDGLDINLAIRILDAANGRIQVAFGIGTHLTNDIGYKAMNIVIKMIQAQIKGRWINTVKLSDNKGKNLGDKKELIVAHHELGLPYELDKLDV